jgi:hypothetical protein
MNITLNGQLVTCTPDEYARLIQLGLIPTQSAGTKVSPIQITPQPSLPDDIVPLPKEDFPQQPTPKNPYEPDSDFWKKNRMHVVALYGCVVDDHTQLGDSVTPFVEVKSNQQAYTSTASNSAVVKGQFYVIKKKDSDEWWSRKSDEFITKNEADARLFSDPSEAQGIIDFIGTRFGELTIVPAKR